jgi:type I restriction enzyme R subunit
MASAVWARLSKINGNTIELIKNKSGGDGTKVINLVKSIEKAGRGRQRRSLPHRHGGARQGRAGELRATPDQHRRRAGGTAQGSRARTRPARRNRPRNFDGLTYFVYRSLLDAKIENAEAVSRKIRQAFADFPNWKRSESSLRELRKKATFAIFAETDDLNRVTAIVDELFTLLEKADRI